MRELHVVALTNDRRHLVLNTKPNSLKGAYLLKITPRLHQALAGQLDDEPDAATAEPGPPVESKLSPKEIQARLRAGETPDRVARLAGVPVDRVTRYYGPVLSERALVVAAAQAATLSRARRGESLVPLGDAVAANVKARGGPVPGDDAWHAFRRTDGSWVVRVEFTMRGRSMRAEWGFQPSTRTLVAADAYSAALGFVEERKAAPAKPAAAKPAAAKPAARAKPAAARGRKAAS